MATKVLIVENEGLFRDMLKVSLSSQDNLDIVGAAGDSGSAVRMARDLSPDVILMDIDLGDGPTGIETGQRVKEDNPNVGIVLLSMHKDKEYLSGLAQDKASGWSYLLKQSVSDLGTLTRAVEGAAAGLMVLDPELVMGMHPRPNSILESLTNRQREVLEYMAQGYSNAAIAEQLVVGEKSVENHINAVYQQLSINRDIPVHPRVRAVLLYLQESRQE